MPHEDNQPTPLDDNNDHDDNDHDHDDDDQQRTEQTIMMLLLNDEHPPPWSCQELQREAERPAFLIQDALDNLARSGLVHLTDDLAYPTRAARRMDELRM